MIIISIFFFFEILYNIYIIYNIILNFLFFFGVSLLILILRTLLYIDFYFSHNFVVIFFNYYYYYFLIIIIVFCDKLVNFYVLGWLLYQRIFNTFRSLPYPCSKLSHTLYYFHILFPYFKLYGHILFVLPLHG